MTRGTKEIQLEATKVRSSWTHWLFKTSLHRHELSIDWQHALVWAGDRCLILLMVFERICSPQNSRYLAYHLHTKTDSDVHVLDVTWESTVALSTGPICSQITHAHITHINILKCALVPSKLRDILLNTLRIERIFQLMVLLHPSLISLWGLVSLSIHPANITEWLQMSTLKFLPAAALKRQRTQRL